MPPGMRALAYLSGKTKKTEGVAPANPVPNQEDKQMAEGTATSRRYRPVTCSLFQMFFQLASGLAYGCPYGRNVTQRIQQTKIMD